MRFHQVRQALDLSLAQGVIVHCLDVFETRPTQDRITRPRCLKQPVQVGGQYLLVGADGAMLPCAKAMSSQADRTMTQKPKVSPARVIRTLQPARAGPELA